MFCHKNRHINYVIGISIGGAMGYYGGKFDLFFQRLIEIWSSLPRSSEFEPLEIEHFFEGFQERNLPKK